MENPLDNIQWSGVLADADIEEQVPSFEVEGYVDGLDLPMLVDRSPCPPDNVEAASFFTPDDVMKTFPEVVESGDFRRVESCLQGSRTLSQEDLLEMFQGDCETSAPSGGMTQISPFASEASSGGMSKESSFLMNELMDIVGEEQGLEKSLSPLGSGSGHLGLSPGTPAEAVDQAAHPSLPSLPSLPVLGDARPHATQLTLRLSALPARLNGFETEHAQAWLPDFGFAVAAPATTVSKTSPPLTVPTVRAVQAATSGRRRAPAAASAEGGGHGSAGDKSYAAVCRRYRIFDSAALAKYRMEGQLARDHAVDSIVDYVKRCMDPERDRVHRFLMVMLVDGQLETGPFWRFFQDAVYFCDASKQRVADRPCPLFHIRQSAYVGLLWGRFKGNECFDYATLGDAIKSVKAKPYGDKIFVDPDFGSLHGKPKRLFQFGPDAFDEICRYRDIRLSVAG